MNSNTSTKVISTSPDKSKMMIIVRHQGISYTRHVKLIEGQYMGWNLREPWEAAHALVAYDVKLPAKSGKD